MKVAGVFSFRKMFPTVDETVKTLFRTETVTPSEEFFDFGIGLFLVAGYEGESAAISMTLISPRGEQSGELIGQTLKADQSLRIAIPAMIKLPVSVGAGWYKCVVRINNEEQYNQPLFELVISTVAPPAHALVAP